MLKSQEMVVAISIQDLIFGMSIFVGLFIIQALLWNLVNLPRQMTVVFGIFLLGPLPFFFFGPLKFPGFLFTLLLSCNYISAFPVFQASSPTLVILDLIYRRRVISEDQILIEMLRYGLVEDRISDLVKGALISREGDTYRLTPKGNLLASFFTAFRNILSLPQGAG